MKKNVHCDGDMMPEKQNKKEKVIRLEWKSSHVLVDKLMKNLAE